MIEDRRRELAVAWLLVFVGACASQPDSEGDALDGSTNSGTESAADQGGDTDGSSETGAWPTASELPPVDCQALPSLPVVPRSLDFVPGCEDFTFDAQGNLVALTKDRTYIKLPYGGPIRPISAMVGDGPDFTFTRGARYLPNNELVIADPAMPALLRMTDDGRTVDIITREIDDPNGVAIGLDGQAYISTLAGQIWRVDPHSGQRVLLAERGDDIERFDGITLGLDFNSVFYNNEDGLEIFELDLATSGPGRLVATIESDQGTSVPSLLDGMAVDECGNLYVTEMHGIVHRVSPDGQVTVVADMTENYPAFITALNFGSGIGGWHAHTLYVMVIQGGMYALDLGVGGKVEPHLTGAELQ